MTAERVPLIRSLDTVGLMDLIRGSYDPAVAVVDAGRDGRLVLHDRPLRWRDALGGPYTKRHEVDMGDHECVLDVQKPPLPSRGDVYAFHAEVHVGFRVSDPVTIVRRRITHGLPVVYHRIVDIMRSVTRDFDIEHSADAETKINSLFDTAYVLDEGLTIYRCVARLLPDAKAQEYLHAKHSAARQLEIQAAEHKVKHGTACQDLELETLRHDAEIEYRKRELDELSTSELDHHRVLFLHLAKHPEDTERILAHLDAHEDKEFQRAAERERRRIELFQFMVHKGLVNAVDVDILRAEAIDELRRPIDAEVALPRTRTWVDESASEALPEPDETMATVFDETQPEMPAKGPN